MRAFLTGSPFAFSPTGFEEESFGTLDPWWDLYLPARMGEGARVRHLLHQLQEPGGETLAVAARALDVLGMSTEAHRYARNSFLKGGEEALSLATFVSVEGENLSVLRMRSAREPGRRADAACDRAVLALRRGNTELALRSVRMALELCADHREAQRWLRFLTQTDAPARASRRYLRDHRTARSVHGIDATELIPGRNSGWMSGERLRRRVIADSGPWRSPSCAYGRLQNAGICETYFSLPDELVGFSAGHVLADLELLADQLVSLVEEAREVTEPAGRLMETARGVDDGARADAAALLVCLSTQCSSLIPLARQGAAELERLCRIRSTPPGGWGRNFWRAALAWSEGSVRRARNLLGEPLEPVPWLLVVHTLKEAGEAELLQFVLQEARKIPLLSSVLEAVESGACLCLPPIPRVTPREAA